MTTAKLTAVSPGLIVESIASGVLAIDLQSRIIFINGALAQRIGRSAAECEGLQATQLFGDMLSGVPLPQTPLYRLPRFINSVRTQSREVQCAGELGVVHLREDSSPLRDEGGNIIGRVFAYHDLNWEKTIDRMKSDFISIASHELRTPMTSIKGSLDLILAGVVGEVSAETADLLKVGRAASERMIRLINDLLDLSKIEAGQIGLKLARVDLQEIVHRVLRNLKVVADEDEIALKADSSEHVPAITVDSDRIEQVITNLVFNAIKYSPVKSTVTVELSANPEWVRCTVQDQGCGIKEEDLDRIFGKFQQASSPIRGASTGLGLAITRALVIEHGGKIWAESTLGQGSRFIFCLPLKVNAPAGQNELTNLRS